MVGSTLLLHAYVAAFVTHCLIGLHMLYLVLRYSFVLPLCSTGRPIQTILVSQTYYYNGVGMSSFTGV